MHMLATLKFPVLGFTEIRLIIKRDYKWLAELVGADLEIEVSEEDFVINWPSKQNIFFTIHYCWGNTLVKCLLMNF